MPGATYFRKQHTEGSLYGKNIAASYNDPDISRISGVSQDSNWASSNPKSVQPTSERAKIEITENAMNVVCGEKLILRRAFTSYVGDVANGICVAHLHIFALASSGSSHSAHGQAPCSTRSLMRCERFKKGPGSPVQYGAENRWPRIRAA